MISLEAFKEAVKRLWDSYLEFYSHSECLFWDTNFEDFIIYPYLIEEEEAEANV